MSDSATPNGEYPGFDPFKAMNEQNARMRRHFDLINAQSPSYADYLASQAALNASRQQLDNECKRERAKMEAEELPSLPPILPTLAHLLRLYDDQARRIRIREEAISNPTDSSFDLMRT